MVRSLLSEWCVTSLFCQRDANYVSFSFGETYSTLSPLGNMSHEFTKHKEQRLVLLNLKAARSAVEQMQLYFSDIVWYAESLNN